MTKTTSRITRISVRLVKDDVKKLAYLSRAEGKSRSEVIRTAIQRYYNDAHSTGTVKPRNLFQTGFVGCAEGDTKLSVTYKRHLIDYLLRKHGYG